MIVVPKKVRFYTIKQYSACSASMWQGFAELYCADHIFKVHSYYAAIALCCRIWPYTREGQKVPATIFFLFTWVHLYKGGSVYIKYEPLSYMPCNMDSVARLDALRH